MTARAPERLITLSDLASELGGREDVLGARIRTEPDQDWCDPWLEATIDNLVVPADLCVLLGDNNFGISDIHPPQLGQTHRKIEIKKDRAEDRSRGLTNR